MPSSLGEAMELAKLIADSDFAPKDYKGKPGNVVIAIQMGHDIGLKPMQALQNIAVVNGRPSIYGDALPALIMASGNMERFHETLEGTGDARVAVCIVKRKGMPDEIRRTFSVADAKKAGLWTKAGVWQNYPDRMLTMRARSWAFRDGFADSLMGLSVAEEAIDIPPSVSVMDVTPEPVESRALSVFERLNESTRDHLEKAFAALAMSAGARLAKINEFLVAEKDPEEQAVLLLEWCRDEYARRKTGQPRAKGNGKRENAASPSAEVASSMGHPVTAAPSPASGEGTPDLHPSAPSADEIFKGAEGLGF
jgi:hypothetical protein